MIRHIGCTAHLRHLRPLRVLPVFETGEIELFMASLNYVERHIYNFEEKVLPEAKRRGIGMIAMKVLGGPMKGPVPRVVDPESYQTTLRYVWGLPEVAVAIIGLRSLEETRQAVAAARNYRPFSKAESAQVSEQGKTLARQWGPLRGPLA